MPSGLSWPKYLSVLTGAMVSMFAGSQCVHLYYRPLDDLEELIQIEMEKQSEQ